AVELSIFKKHEMTLRHTRGGHYDQTGATSGSVYLKYREVAAMYGFAERGRVGQVSFEAGPSIGFGKVVRALDIADDVDFDGPKRAVSFGIGIGASAYLTPFKYVGIGLEAPVIIHEKVIGWAVMPSVKVGKLF
ncbi:MAG: hypothetical protein ABEK29_10380, partial [Bradymonadaceae bacterium]